MTNTKTVQFDTGRAEMLPNGFVRVDLRSGLVHVWELAETCEVLRSGNGTVTELEHQAVRSVFVAAGIVPEWLAGIWAEPIN